MGDDWRLIRFSETRRYRLPGRGRFRFVAWAYEWLSFEFSSQTTFSSPRTTGKGPCTERVPSNVSTYQVYLYILILSSFSLCVHPSLSASLSRSCLRTSSPPVSSSSFPCRIGDFRADNRGHRVSREERLPFRSHPGGGHGCLQVLRDACRSRRREVEHFILWPESSICL